MYKVIYFLIWFHIILTQPLHDTISAELALLGNEYKTYIQLGVRIVMLDIRQDKNTTEIIKELYEPSDKSVIHNNSINDNYTVVQDVVMINEHTSATNPDFYFIISKSEDESSSFNRRDASIGLSFYFNDTNYSLVHTLTKNNIINKNIYTISPFNNAVYFGKVNEFFYREYNYIGSCSVETGNVNWGCQLLSVTYEDNTININNNNSFEKKVYTNKYYTQFTSKEKLITAPPDFYEMIKESFLKKYFDQHLCDSYQLFMDPEIIKCKFSIMNELGTFIFKFKEITIKIKGRELFREGVDDCFLKIRTTLSMDNKWVFGMSILSEVISSYDYDNKTITLFSNSIEITQNINDYLNESTIHIIKLSCIITIIFLNIINIGLFMFYCKYLHYS